MSKKILGLTVMLTVAGCGSRHPAEATSEIKYDIDIPKNYITAQELQNIALGVASTLQEGENQVTLAEIFASMKLQGPITKIIPGILEAHPNPLTVFCKGQKCAGFSNGKSHNFILDWVNLPLYGNPNLTLASHAEMELKISSDGRNFEICKIVGLSARVLGINVPIDGSHFELEGDGIKQLMFDLGAGGTYSNSNCDPKIQAQN